MRYYFQGMASGVALLRYVPQSGAKRPPAYGF